MKYKVNKAGLVLAKLCSGLFPAQFRTPQPQKGRYDVATNTFEKLKWAYKCWVRQMESAEAGSGLEAYFRGQDLTFAPPAGFEARHTLRMSAGGDLMAVDVITPQNTPKLFEGIKGFYFDADIVSANLESTVYAKAPYGRNQKATSAGQMNTSEEMLDRFAEGIHYFSTANNHSYDYGEEGLLATLDVLDKRGLWHSGTSRTPQERDDVLIIEQNGIKVAMLAYTFDTNGIQYEKEHLINEVRFNDETHDLSLIERQVQAAKTKGADIIVAHCHWGWEFEMYPHKATVETAHRIADMGADVIIGSHPHVAQPMERYAARRPQGEQQVLIVYSLGDFVSYHPLTRNSKLTYVIRFDVQKGRLDGKEQTFLANLEVLPVYILAEDLQATGNATGGREDDFRLLPFEQVLATGGPALSEEERADLPRLDKQVLRGILLPESWGFD